MGLGCGGGGFSSSRGWRALGWLSWTALGTGVEAGGPDGCPGRWGPVPPWCSVAGGPVFQAQVMAAGVGSGSQRWWGGWSGCPGVRGCCWFRAGLPRLRRGACGERRLLRSRCSCGAGRVQGCRAALGAPWGAGTRLHMGAVGMESSVQKTGHLEPLGWGSARLPMARLLSALTILTCLLCTCREGDLTLAERGDQS